MKRAKEHILSKLKPILKELTLLDLSDNDINLDPASEKFGDYTTNVAMQAFKVVRSPNLPTPPYYSRKIAAKAGSTIELADKIKAAFVHPDGVVEKIDVIKPGFINFWLSEDYLKGLLKAPVTPSQSLKGKKIMVEFTDPNPFKLFHIGHLYSNIIGEAISRLFEASGTHVKRVNYQGDVGLHVAKSIWGIQKEMKQNHEDLKAWKAKPLEIRIQFLARGYTLGNKAYEEDENTRKEIIGINKKIYEKDKSIEEIYEKGKKWSLDYFEKIYKRLGTKFERYYFESEAGQIGLNLVKEYLKKGIFEKSEGAIIFPGEKYGLHNRVFVNSEGLPTYEAKELGLAPTKYKDFPYDKSIIVTGNEINEYFKVVLATLSKINPGLASKTVHISHGMVRLSGGKISSRLGNIISGESLLDGVKSKIKENFKDMDDDTAEKVTIAAVKYALLRMRIGKDIDFDINQSISLNGDSGPYILYSYVRTQSVLANAPTKLLSNKINGVLKEEDIIVLRLLNKFQDIVADSVSNFAPNILCNYLFELSHKFNLLYQKHRILNNSSRLKITRVTGEVIRKSLTILGVEAPQRM